MLAILPIYILVHSITASVSGIYTASSLRKQAQEQALLLSRTYSEQLDGTISQYLNTAQNLSSAVVTAINIESILKEYKSRYPEFSHMFYTQTNGIVRDMAPYRKAFIGSDLHSLQSWKKASVHMSPVLGTPETFYGQMSVIFYSPVLIRYVKHQEPVMEGLVGMVLPLEELFKSISTVKVGESGSLFILDNQGRFLFHKEPSFILSCGLEALKPLEPLDDLSDSMVDQKTGFASYSDRVSRKYISFSPIPSGAWSLAVLGSYQDITRDVRTLTLTNFTILLIGLFLGSLILYHAVHSVVRPVEILTERTRKIQEGETAVSTIIDDNSEIGVLSGSINSMVTELNKNREDLERIVEDRTMELKRTNEELEQTVEELNETNLSLQSTKDSLEEIVAERTVQLRKAHNYIDNIINSMPSVLIGVNPEGTITHWNNKAETLTGLGREHAIGKSICEAVPQLTDEMENIRKALKTRTERHETNRMRIFSNKTFFDDVTVYPLIANGVEGAVIRIDDVTDRVVMEESLRQSQKLDAIGQLAGGVAHDFNNMLGGILGSSELMKMSLDDPEKAENYLNMIIDSTRNAADLTNKLLLFSRKGVKESVPVDVHSAIDSAITLLEHSLDKKVRILSSLAAESAIVLGDFVQLQNVFINLGINADHAMPNGGELIFSSRNEKLSEDFCSESSFEILPGWYIIIEIRDSGTGIDQDHMERIFEPFFTTKDQGAGTGLGLSVVYGAVKHHRGAVSVDSVPQKGTTFTLYLPIYKGQSQEKEEGNQHIDGTGHILVIEDDPIIRKTTKAILEKLGYTVLLAEDGQKGIDIYKSEQRKIDLVLMDMIMPVMNGKECFRELKVLNPDVKVIMASGYTDIETDEIRNMGLTGFIKKPYDRSSLSIAVSKAI